VLLWYLGMIFVITQDALEYALVTRLPDAYFAANETARTAIAAFGGSLGTFIERKHWSATSSATSASCSSASP
jgi:hypothetical protein